MNKISNFFKKNNLLANIILTVLSTFLTEFLASFLNDIISPLIDFNKDGIEDSKNLSSYKVKVNGRELRVGNMIVSSIRLVIIILIMILLIYFMK
jgi:large-conductance mechanosensitive channel